MVLGLISGLAHYLGLLYWIVYVTHVFGHLPLPVSLGVLLLLAAYLSLYRALWAGGLSWGAARGLNLLWWAPALWVVVEFGQTYIISGFPWELLGYGLYRYPLLLQVADLTGVYGLSFLVVLVNATLYLVCVRPPGAAGTRPGSGRRGLPPFSPVARLWLLPSGRGPGVGGPKP